MEYDSTQVGYDSTQDGDEPRPVMVSRKYERDIIEDIRRALFGSEFMANGYQNALKVVARDLYSSSVHFVDEIIQNAEDNTYAEGKRRTLHFVLWKDSASPNGILAVINNETGLREKDVRALCTIGESTKKDRKADGLIGEKGMGFKSVFVVSRTPWMFSNGFQIAFDEEKDPDLQVGYIVPNWKERKDLPARARELVEQYEDHTVLLLPLKAKKYELVAKHLAALRPELFVGLPKLEEIQVEVDGCPALVTSCDRSDPSFLVLSVKRGPAAAQTIRVFVRDEMIDVPASIEEEKREGVTKRPFRVALALSEDGMQLLSGKVFAYLPTEMQSRLPFAINADWILTASREQMHKPSEKAWNAWVLRAISGVFVRGFRRLLDDKKERCRAYASIPLVGEGDFSEVYETIVKELQRLPCVLCEDGLFRRPREVLIGPAKLYGLLKGKETPEVFAMQPLVAEAVVAEGPAALNALRSLGVGSVGEKEIMAWLSDSTWLAQQSDHDSRKQFHLDLYEFLMADCKDWTTHAKLSPLNLIPSAKPAPGATRPFLSLRPTEKTAALAQLQAVEACSSVSAVLPVAHPAQAILDARSKDEKLKHWLENRLGLKSFNYGLWLEEFAHRLSAMVADGKLTVDCNLAAFSFIRKQWAARPDSIPEAARSTLAAKLPILVLADSKQTVFVPSECTRQLLLPPNAIESVDVRDTNFVADWPKVLPDAADRADFYIVSTIYVESDPEGIESAGAWRDFFIRVLGMPRMPSLNRTVTCTVQDLHQSVQKVLGANTVDSMRRAKKHHIHLTQPRIPSWIAAAGSKAPGSAYDDTYLAQCTALLNWIEVAKVDCVKAAKVEFHFTPKSATQSGTAMVDSELWRVLHTVCWFPTTIGLQMPSSAYLSEYNEIAALLGSKRPCIAIDLPDRLRTAFNFKTSESASVFVDVRDRLMEIAQSESLDAANLAALQKMYAFVHQRARIFGLENVQTLFANKKLIYVSACKRWLKTGDVVWSNRGSGTDLVPGNALPELFAEYPNMKPFFVDLLGVKEHLEARVFAERWRQLGEGSVPASREEREVLERELKQCYMALENMLNEQSRPEWWESWVANAAVYTGDAFVPASKRDLVLLPDDEDLERLFADDVKFAWVPSGGLGAFQDLFAALALRPISEAARPKIGGCCKPTPGIPQGKKCTPELRESVARMLFNSYPAVYRKAKGDGVNGQLSKILRAVDCPTSTLNVVYELDGIERADSRCSAFFDWSCGKRFYNLWWKVAVTKRGRNELVELEEAASLAYAFAGQFSSCLFQSLDDREVVKRLDDSLQLIFSRTKEQREAKWRSRSGGLPDEERAWITSTIKDADKALEEALGGPLVVGTSLAPGDEGEVDDDLVAIAHKRKKGSGAKASPEEIEDAPTNLQSWAREDVEKENAGSTGRGVAAAGETAGRAPFKAVYNMLGAMENSKDDKFKAAAAAKPAAAAKKAANAAAKTSSSACDHVESDDETVEPATRISAAKPAAAGRGTVLAVDHADSEISAGGIRKPAAAATGRAPADRADKEMSAGHGGSRLAAADKSAGGKASGKAASSAAVGIAGPGDAELDVDPTPPAERQVLKEAGLQLVLAYEADRGWIARRVQGRAGAQPACDVESREQPDEAVARRIELQALNGEWDGSHVTLDAAQLMPALLRGDTYWLYVVENAGDPAQRRLRTIQNPIKAMKKLHFRGDWRFLAAESFMLAGRAVPAAALAPAPAGRMLRSSTAQLRA